MLLSAAVYKRLIEDGIDKVANSIVLGDCLDSLRLLPDNSIDLIHTSPPYNIDKPYKSSRRDRDDLSDYTAFLADVIAECRRVLKPNGSIFWQTGYTDMPGGVEGDILPIDHLSDRFFREKPNPMILWDRIIWRYLGGMAFKRKFTNRHETILWFVKVAGEKTEPTFNVDAVRESSRSYDSRNNLWGRNPGNVWEHDRVAYGSIEQTSHVAVYPLAVAERIVLSCSKEGDVVLDPFSGSGTTPLAARIHGRRWLGFEISDDYADESIKRLSYAQDRPENSLAAGILAHSVFGGQQGERTLAEAAERFLPALQSRHVRDRRVDFDLRLMSVLPDGYDGREIKKAKQVVWEYYDSLIRESQADPIVQFHRMLEAAYPLRKDMNGLTAYKTALEVIERLIRCVEASVMPEFIRTVITNAPSMFGLDGDFVCLNNIERRIKAVVPESKSQLMPLEMIGGT